MQSRAVRRFPWVALLIGFLLGLIGGLIYAWFLNPVKWVDVAPDRLNAQDQQAYILLISEAYLQDFNLARAQARLQSLGVHDIASVVATQADSAFLRGDDNHQVYALTVLAEALGAQPLAASVFSGTAIPTAVPPQIMITLPPLPTSTPTDTPAPTSTPFIPTSTPSVSAVASLALISLQTVCEDDQPAGRIEVYVYDELGQGVPAVRVVVAWGENQEAFFTGLKPDIDPGYADFQMEPDQSYSVVLDQLAEPVTGLTSSACTTPAGQTSMLTYQLIFAPPSVLTLTPEEQ
jgi:hypothetical protein